MVLVLKSCVAANFPAVTFRSAILAVSTASAANFAAVTDKLANFAVVTESSEGVVITPTPIRYMKFIVDVAAITESNVIVATDVE